MDEVEDGCGSIASATLDICDGFGQQRLHVGVDLRLRIELRLLDHAGLCRLTIGNVAEDVGGEADDHCLEDLRHAGIDSIASLLGDLLNRAEIEEASTAVRLNELSVRVRLGDEVPSAKLNEASADAAALLHEQAGHHPDVRFLHAELCRLRGHEQLVARCLTWVVGVLVAADPVLGEEIRATSRAGDQESAERDRKKSSHGYRPHGQRLRFTVNTNERDRKSTRLN